MDPIKHFIAAMTTKLATTISLDIKQQLRLCATVLTLENKEQLQNDNSAVYYVCQGIIRSYYIDIAGNEATQFFYPADSFCCGEALFTSDIFPLHYESISRVVLIKIPVVQLKRLIAQYAPLQTYYITLLEAGIYYKLKREQSFLIENATERFLAFKNDFPELSTQIPQNYLASYLGITPTSLSRIKKNLKELL